MTIALWQQAPRGPDKFIATQSMTDAFDEHLPKHFGQVLWLHREMLRIDGDPLIAI